MQKTLYIRPAQGLTIPNPATGHFLPAHGEAVDDSPYWRRRLRERSVEPTSPQAIARAAATPPAATAPAVDDVPSVSNKKGAKA